MSKKKFFCKLIVRVSPIDSPGHPSFKTTSSPMQSAHAIGGHLVQLKYSDITNQLKTKLTEKELQDAINKTGFTANLQQEQENE